MILQCPTWTESEPMGHMIDFGLSAYAHENMEPYIKERTGKTFTSDYDCGRIKKLRKP